MQFQVPQFIEAEDKIIGPLTLKQFGYLAVAGAVIFMLFFRLNLFLWLLVSTLVGAAGAALAFIAVNGRPVSAFLLAALSYLWRPKVYTFRPKEPATQARVPLSQNGGGIKNLLHNLTTSKNAIPKREPPLTESFGVLSKKDLSDRYEVIRSITGGREKARRVDYR